MTDMYTMLTSVGGNLDTTTLVCTDTTTCVWQDREEAPVKYDASDPDNCYTTWTEGLNYPYGATLCDGVVYQCVDPALCGVDVPGAGDSTAVWAIMGGATVPSS